MVGFGVGVVVRSGGCDLVVVGACPGDASSWCCRSCAVGFAVGFGWGGVCVIVLERREEAEGQVRQAPWKAGRRGGGLVEQVREGCVERFGIVPNSIHSRSERWKAFTVGCCSGCWKL